MPNAKEFIVIGGTQGIGAALVRQLSQSGHGVLAVGRNAPTSPFAKVRYIQHDVLSGALPPEALPDSLQGMAYCPGSINLKPFHALKNETFLADFQLNVLGAVQMLRQAFPALVKGAGASVVLFSTVAAQTGMPFHASVAASKGALEALGRSLAAEWARNNIRVNVVAPSLTETRMAHNLLRTEQQREASAQRHPLGRIGQPEDVAKLAAFLLSEDSGWITGQVLHVDGGMGQLRLI